MTQSEGSKLPSGSPGDPHDNGATAAGAHQAGASQSQSQGAGQSQSQGQSPSQGQSQSQSQSRVPGPATVPLPEPRPDAVRLETPPAQGYDEMLVAETEVRAAYAPYARWLAETSGESLQRKRDEADLIFRRTGITFSVYGDESGTERLIPSDVVPRIISADDWARLCDGLVQRVNAINHFLADVYHRQEIIRAGRFVRRVQDDVNACRCDHRLRYVPRLFKRQRRA